MNGSLSCEYSRLLERGNEIGRTVMEIILQGFAESEHRATMELNDRLYQMCKDSGMSLYDLCLSTKPSIKSYVSKEGAYCYEIEIVPLELEPEKDCAYWMEKYYRLKEKLQEIINDKED